MKTLYHILGGLFLIVAVVWIISVIVAVATQKEGYTTFSGMIPGIAIHLVSSLLGVVFIGLGNKVKKTA